MVAMVIRRLCSALIPAGLWWGMAIAPTLAMPGQPTAVVAAWILGNQALEGVMGDGLSVRRSNGGSQTFEFTASIFPPGRLSPMATRGSCATPVYRGLIRSETITVRDFINGVPLDRLEFGLRTVYGLDIYQDYRQASLLYAYPLPAGIDLGRRLGRPGTEGYRGEMRRGDRYAYWLEIAHTETGMAYSGQITVFLKEDLPKLVREMGGELDPVCENR